ncbi:OLC1v1012411C1 [Oldenlandia corymbosa var. corymbosa]|uniref:OLC1v1012411C1 n=1 Tax=Oldenlandia corymbosa var. corymbosa TaxID=529605 RepID=A0AAV1DVW4_OLDCO|nr:OLC1v1012411C1 [Oldenlandia corymbosa var. corymbosa]
MDICPSSKFPFGDKLYEDRSTWLPNEAAWCAKRVCCCTVSSSIKPPGAFVTVFNAGACGCKVVHKNVNAKEFLDGSPFAHVEEELMKFDNDNLEEGGWAEAQIEKYGSYGETFSIKTIMIDTFFMDKVTLLDEF